MPIINKLKKIKGRIRKFFGIRLIKSIRDLIIFQQNHEFQQKHPNPLNSYGKKCFSQNDEDGITLEIIKRMKITKGVFAEISPGNGLENNTISLAALKWKGFWLGSEDISFRYKNSKNFQFLKVRITKENILEYYNTTLQKINENKVDVLSLDLDGNDIYVLEEILKKSEHPNLIITEYNAKFPPPIKFKINYDPNHVWRADDYFGASLSEFTSMMDKYSYSLICCNSNTGTNAFFIKNDFIELFKEVPKDIEKIYVAPRYQLYERYGHPQSTRTIELIFDQLDKLN